MKLSEADAGRFFNLMGRLQHHVNRRLGLIPGELTPEMYSELPPSQRAKVRDALWKDPGAIDAYVAENPDSLPAEELAIAEGWKRFVSGTFQIVRLLKRHAVFVGSDSRVYAVLALHDSIEDLLLGRPLPVAVTAVLLPFEGKIVYDGFLGLYNVTFGPGIRRRLHETYMTAKQSGSILETLEPEEARPPAARAPERPRRDWSQPLDDILERAGRLKGGTPMERAAFGLLLAGARLARGAASDPGDPGAVAKAETDLRRALGRWRTMRARLAPES